MKDSGHRGVRYFPSSLCTLCLIIKKTMWGLDFFFFFDPFFRESGVTTCNCMNVGQLMKAFYFFMTSSKAEKLILTELQLNH